MNDQTCQELTEAAINSLNFETNKQKERLVRKYENLRKESLPQAIPKSVVNLSDKNLTEDQMRVLSRGEKFSFGSKEQDKYNFIATIESTILDLQVSNNDKANLRQCLTCSVQIKHQQHSTLTHEEKRALREIKQDSNISVVPADKGNALVVIDKSTYDDKQKEHLNDENTYQKLQSNPVHMLRNKVNKELKDLKEKKELSSEDYRRLYVNTSVTPRFYGTIKIFEQNLDSFHCRI